MTYRFETAPKSDAKLLQIASVRPKSGESIPDIERDIISEIRRLQANRNRAYTASVVNNLTKRLGLPGSVLSIQLSEMVSTGKVRSVMYRGKESFCLPGESDDSSTDEEDESDSESHSEEKRHSPHKFLDSNHLHTASSTTPVAEKWMTVTIPASILSDLTKGMNVTNELLSKERELTHKLWIENTDLKLRIKDLEAAITIGPSCTQQQKRDNANTPLGNSTIENSQNEAEKDKTASSSSQKPKANRSKNPKRKSVVEIPSESEEEENKATSSGKNTPKNQNTTSKVSHVKKQNNKWGNKNAQSTAKMNNKDKKNETKNVLIIGDSQLRKIDGVTLSNNNHNHNVTVDAMPGARIARMKSTRINKDTDVVIVHAGTCNIKKQTDPEKLADEIVSTLRDIKSSCPRAQVAFSSIIKRNDDLELNAKVIKTNQILEEKLLFSGLDYVNNDNVKYGMISTDGLHVNDGGVRMLASNFSKYIRYC